MHLSTSASGSIAQLRSSVTLGRNLTCMFAALIVHGL